MTLKRISLALALACTMALAIGCPGPKGPDTSDAVKKVASLDEEVIYQLPMFTDAEKALNKWAEEESKRLAELAKGKDEKGRAELFRQYQLELQKKTNETMNPLKEKARAAVATAAKDRKVTVVLDKKIVVFGVPDITEDAKALLTSGKELTYPDEVDPVTAPIGYFDQNVIRNLKVFKEVEIELLAERKKLYEEYQKRLGEKPSQAEIAAAKKAIDTHMESAQQAKLGPLYKAVTDSVADVAKAEKLSLVLDTQHVMHGGRNLTELVVDSFLKKVGSGVGEKPKASATPAGGK